MSDSEQANWTGVQFDTITEIPSVAGQCPEPSSQANSVHCLNERCKPAFSIQLLRRSNREFSSEINRLLPDSSQPAVRNPIGANQADLSGKGIGDFIHDGSSDLCDGRSGDLTALRSVARSIAE